MFRDRSEPHIKLMLQNTNQATENVSQLQSIQSILDCCENYSIACIEAKN